MACGANYAWANRQLLMHRTREIFEKTLRMSPRELGMRLVYDVCHNIAKIEEFKIEGKMKKLCVHRKGATRAFPAGHDALPERYKSVGQPVLIPGDMGQRFLCFGRSGKSDGGDIRQRLSWRGAGDEPDSRQSKPAGADPLPRNWPNREF